METRNESETLFEQYLDSNGFRGKWIYEPSILGKSKKLDYLLNHNNQEILFEVKELRRKRNETGKQTSVFNPYSSLRKEIHEVRKQFKEYKSYICSLVVCNVEDSQFRSDPRIILGAMLGNLGIKASYNIEKNEFVKENAFLKCGKMIDYKRKQPQNTTISAIIVLEEFRDNIEIEKAMKNEEKEHGKEFEILEFIKVRMKLHKTYRIKSLPRIIIAENPYARIAFPAGLFKGPFDERWGWIEKNGKIERIFVGSKLKELESLKSNS